MAVPIDKKLYDQAKATVYKQYAKPSAYRSGALIKEYKRLGGRFQGDKQDGLLTRWFDEKWMDVGKSSYPVYRPTIKISPDTPLTVLEIDPKNLQKQIKLKQKIKGKKNLPPFKKKS